MRLFRPLAKNIYANKPREKNKQRKQWKQINKIIEKEREIPKLIYSIKPKNYVT